MFPSRQINKAIEQYEQLREKIAVPEIYSNL
ncbi:unnamed protein product, partial [marine sediment metagenome]